ncbi:MAG: amino acid adenylation domain-containing protein, partial [Mycobacteriaceae bacterium]
MENISMDMSTENKQTKIESEARVFPLSAAQRGIWYASALGTDTSATIAQYVDVPGMLDVNLLSLAGIAAAAELGSGFLHLREVDGEPMQYVDSTVSDGVSYLDFRCAEDPVGAAQAWMKADSSKSRNLYQERLLAAYVLQIADNRCFWYSRADHVALDGYGAMTLMRRTAELYTEAVEGLTASESKAAHLYDIYQEEEQYRLSTRFERDREYWMGKVVDLPEPISLAGRSLPTSSPASLAISEMPKEVAESLDEAVQQHSSAAPAVIAAFASFLCAMTGQRDVVLSLPVSARTTAMLRHSAGMVANVVPLRIKVSPGKTAADLVRDVQIEIAGALRRQRFRHEDIRRLAGATAGERGWFGPSVNIMMFHPEIRLGSYIGTFQLLSTGPIDDLALNLYPAVAGGQTRIDFEANPNLYQPETLQRHQKRFIEYLGKFLKATKEFGVQASVDAIDVMFADERMLVVQTWNDTQRRVPLHGESLTLPDLFAVQVNSTPNAFAVEFASETITFISFDQRTNQLARSLVAYGVGPDIHVGIAIERSLELLVAIYAVLKAGGVYVPIDPHHPATRIENILETASPELVLTISKNRECLQGQRFPVLVIDTMDLAEFSTEQLTNSDRIANLYPQSGAYTLFTSGSTGRPKGVTITHEAIVNRLAWMQDSYPINASDVVLQKTPTTFDVSIWELFWPLQVGALLVIAEPEGHRDPQYLARIIHERKVTVIHFVPSMLAAFCSEDVSAQCSSLRYIFSSGEALPISVAAAALNTFSAQIHNLYGPTEAAVDVTAYSVKSIDKQDISIGSPIWNTKTYVLDSRLNPVPVGARGELYLAGIQLARGYTQASALTADRFIADPFSATGSRMYRTGDLVEWLEDGNLRYLGRIDFQVKLRGLRIELGEIESALLAEDSVDQAVAVVRSDDGNEQLVAYVIPAGESIDSAELRRVLIQQLPAYMVPQSIEFLTEFPLS